MDEMERKGRKVGGREKKRMRVRESRKEREK